MSDDETYNGWTNWDTWNAYLWLSNDQDTYLASRAAAKRDDLHKLKWLVHHETKAVSGDGVQMPKVNWDEIVAALKEG